MKSTKEMQLLSNAQVATGARQTFGAMNTNPSYLFRTMNKVAEGKNVDYNAIAKETGMSKVEVCEQYNRLQEVAGCGGYWWGSVIARQGYIITGAKKVVIGEGDDAEGGTAMYVAKGGEVITEVINGELYSLRAATNNKTATTFYTMVLPCRVCSRMPMPGLESVQASCFANGVACAVGFQTAGYRSILPVFRA